MNLTEPTDVEGAKRKNIIEIALSFTAMIRIFTEGSKKDLSAKLEELFLSLFETHNCDDYEVRHRSFCEWFTQTIRTAEKTLKNGKVQPGGQSSYGKAAKVLDIAIKVYVDYCAQPTPEVAERIVPLLHGAIDTPILGHLKKSNATGKIRATTIKGLDQEAYLDLQSQLFAESRARKLYPVQYDDILWRSLSR